MPRGCNSCGKVVPSFCQTDHPLSCPGCQWYLTVVRMWLHRRRTAWLFGGRA